MKFLYFIGLLTFACHLAYAANTTLPPPRPVIIDEGGNLKIVTPQSKNTPLKSPAIKPVPPARPASPTSTQPPVNVQPVKKPSTGTPMPSMEGITPGTTPGGYIQDAPK